MTSLKSLGEPLPGPGNLYPWRKGQIIKVYDQHVPKDWVAKLGLFESTLHGAGLPVPWVGELVEIEGHLGQVYERIEGNSMADELFGLREIESERILQIAQEFAEVHAGIHACKTFQADLPSINLLADVIRRIEALPTDLKSASLQALERMHTNRRLCHGDFHPYNVLMSPRGPVVIDWNNAHFNNPLEDVARSRLLLTEAAIMEPSIRSVLEMFKQAYLERYFQIHPADPEQMEAWHPIVAAVRMAEGIYDNHDWLLEQVRNGLGM